MASVTDPIIFFAARTTNADSTAYPASFPKGEGEFQVYGTFDGATITLKFSPDGGTTYVTVKDLGGTDVAITSAKSVPVRSPLGQLLRASLTGAGAATSLTAKYVVL